jgi:hypothetical protein
MKKKIIYSSALAALLSASSIALAGGPEFIPVEDYFSGFYLGGTGAFHHADLEGSTTTNFGGNTFVTTGRFAGIVTTVPMQTLAVNDTSGRSLDGYGGVQGGFGWTFNHQWYLGIIGFGEFGKQSSTSSTNKTLDNFDAFHGAITNLATANTNLNIQVESNYGVAAKLGWVVAPRTMVYGKVGASWATIDVTETSSAANDFTISAIGVPIFNDTARVVNPQSTNSDTKLGLLLGIGFEQFVYADLVSVNVEYDYVNYGSVNTDPTFLQFSNTVTVIGSPPVDTTPNGSRDTNLSSSGSGKATINSLLVGVNFYFGRDWF